MFSLRLNGFPQGALVFLPQPKDMEVRSTGYSNGYSALCLIDCRTVQVVFCLSLEVSAPDG